MLALFLLLTSAQAASLDLLEVGGVWGTPAATNPTAVWWNPAGLAAGQGTQFVFEGAPSWARVDVDRANPPYDSRGGADFNYGGAESLHFKGTVPFLGVSSDFGVKDLGVGIALAVPFARGGTEDPDPGPGQFHLRHGNIQAVYLMAGAGWTFFDKVSIGVSGAMVHSTWEARTQVETLKSLRDGIVEQGFADPYCNDQGCDDYLFEDPNYSAELTFNPLKDRAFTFGAGVYVTPVDKLGISVAYSHGMRLDHEGTIALQFGCPTDAMGSFAAQFSGMCNADAEGTGAIGYRLPSRLNFGVVLEPVEILRAELMGGWVGWSAFTDYDITTRVEASQFEDELCDKDGDGIADECNDLQKQNAEKTAGLVSQDRQWARDNKDSFWVGVDAKVKAHRFLTVGGRVLYDHTAIPSPALSTNNYDAPAVTLGAVAVFTPLEQLGISLSFGRQFLATRTVEDSAFAVTLADNPKPDRYFYPSANGTYSAGINRVGIAVTGKFWAKD